MQLLTEQDFASDVDRLLNLLQELVEHESPSTEKSALDILGAYLGERMKTLGANVERYSQSERGDHWSGTWGEGSGGILLLAHYDTVYPMGTLAAMPWRREAGYVYGPGCLDMKGSIAMALTVIDRLGVQDMLRSDRITLLCTSDEEIGSESSRDLIVGLAGEHELTLCLEPALPGGALKTWRKGILNFDLHAHGRAAHAGSDPQSGVNAIEEIARQIPGLLALADDSRETTLNLGVIAGGSRSNVVPERCSLQLDVRAKTRAEGDRVLAKLKALSPMLEGARVVVEGGWNRPPMERDEQMQASFQRAAEIAGSIGLELGEGGTGGGSDANFVAGEGTPVLDGLGLLGSGAHSPEERVELNSLTSRCALLAALLCAW